MAEAKKINRSVYGQYGLTQLDGFEVPYLSASQAERLAQPGERWQNASHEKGSYIKDLGWSGNAAKMGYKLYSASYLYAPHIMHKRMMQDFLSNGDSRGNFFATA